MSTHDPIRIRSALERLTIMAAAPEGEAMQRLLGAPIDARWYADLRRPAAPLEGEPSDEELLEMGQFHCISYTLSNGTVISPYQGEGTDIRSEVLSYARAVLARWGRPAAPLEGEVGELVEWLRQRCQLMSEAPGSEFHLFTRAAALLEQFSAAAPAVAPIPVSERLPGSKDCDADGRCWWFDGDWKSQQVRYRGAYASHWLPAHALPLPAPQGGEVEE